MNCVQTFILTLGCILITCDLLTFHCSGFMTKWSCYLELPIGLFDFIAVNVFPCLNLYFYLIWAYVTNNMSFTGPAVYFDTYFKRRIFKT